MALVVNIPGWRSLELEHLVLDLNGTLALDGALIPGVLPALEQLRASLQLHLVTADTFGTAAGLFQGLVKVQVLSPGQEAQQKLELVQELGAQRVAAVGNGANDVLMLKEAALGVAVLGPEGACPQALLSAQVAVPDIAAALGLFLHPQRLRATLRR